MILDAKIAINGGETWEHNWISGTIMYIHVVGMGQDIVVRYYMQEEY